MAFQHAMQAGYTSFEGGMKRLFALLDEPQPTGADAALPHRLGRPVEGSQPAVLDGPPLTQLSELRRFRDIAMHASDDFEPVRAVAAVEAARVYLLGIAAALDRFRAAVDPG